MSIWPALTMISLGFLSLGMNMAKHGQPGRDYDAWTTMIAMGITWSILWWGGFFDTLLAKL